jgi:large subunit ribosomal protein L25
MQGNRVELKATPRTTFGKKNKALRRSGWVPANISGRGVASTAIQFPTRDLEHVLAHTSRNTLLSIGVDGTEETVLLHGVARRPTTDDLYHVDFLRVSLTDPVRAFVPLVFVGEAPAVKAFDAVVLHSIDRIEVEALPQNLPTQLEVSLDPLEELDAAIHVRDLRAPAGVTVLTDGDELVTKALAPTIEVEEVPEAAAEEAAPAEAAAAEEPEAEAEAEAEA